MSIYCTEAHIRLKDKITTSSGLKKPITVNLYAQRPVGSRWYMIELQGYVRFVLDEYATIIISEDAFWTLAMSLLGVRIPYELRERVPYVEIHKREYFTPKFTLKVIKELLKGDEK